MGQVAQSRAVLPGTIFSTFWQTEELQQTQTDARNNHAYGLGASFIHTGDGRALLQAYAPLAIKQENVFVPRTSAEHLHSCTPLTEILLQIKRKASQSAFALALCPSQKDEQANINQKILTGGPGKPAGPGSP